MAMGRERGDRFGLDSIEDGGIGTYIPGDGEWSVDWDDLVLAGGVDREGIGGGGIAAWCLVAG